MTAATAATNTIPSVQARTRPVGSEHIDGVDKIVSDY